MSGNYSFPWREVFRAKAVLIPLFTIVFCVFIQTAFARKVHNRRFKFKMSLPSTMKIINDTAEGEIYYDTVTSVVLIITARESKFHNVDDYINCSRKDLDTVLKNWSADSTLQIISCDKTKKATILHFRIGSSFDGYQDNIIYFIHHKAKDIQFSFIHSGFTTERGTYADDIMSTLKLR